MKYIDAEKLIAEIERRRLSNRYIDTEGYEAELFKIIGYLQQEQKLAAWSDEDEENLGLVIDCIYKYYPPVMKYKLKGWLESICPRLKPDVDLEEEMTAYIERHFHIRCDETLEVGNDPLTTHDFEEIARHFTNFGLNARKEK